MVYCLEFYKQNNKFYVFDASKEIRSQVNGKILFEKKKKNNNRNIKMSRSHWDQTLTIFVGSQANDKWSETDLKVRSSQLNGEPSIGI